MEYLEIKFKTDKNNSTAVKLQGKPEKVINDFLYLVTYKYNINFKIKKSMTFRNKLKKIIEKDLIEITVKDRYLYINIL